MLETYVLGQVHLAVELLSTLVARLLVFDMGIFDMLLDFASQSRECERL